MRASSLFLIAIACACGSSTGASEEATPTLPAEPPARPPPNATAPPPPTADDAGASDAAASSPLWLVLSAFPAEQAPLVAEAKITSMQTIAGKTFRIGTLGGARVALGLVGMGLPNATMTSHAAIAALSPAGVIFSGTAGSNALRIGDVVVATSWKLKTTATYAPDAKWLAIAKTLAPCFEQCTEVPATGSPVCMDHVPGLLVGGNGQSDDTSLPVSCQTGNDDVFGCDVGVPQGEMHMCAAAGSIASAGSDPISTDNETAAVAAEAAARGIPFIAFRGMSDGAGDPLGLPGYPAEFFAYYRLAARNAAAAATAFLSRL